MKMKMGSLYVTVYIVKMLQPLKKRFSERDHLVSIYFKESI